MAPDARTKLEQARGAARRLAAAGIALDALECYEWSGRYRNRDVCARRGAGAHGDPTAAAALDRDEALARYRDEYDALAELVERADAVLRAIGDHLGEGYERAVRLRYLSKRDLGWPAVGARLGCTGNAARQRARKALEWVDERGWDALAGA